MEFKPCHFCDGKGYISAGHGGTFYERMIPCYMCRQTGQLATDWNTLVQINPGCWVVKGNRTEEEAKSGTP